MAAPANSNLKAFQRTLTLADFGTTSDLSLVTTSPNRLGTLVVGAQKEATFGQSVSIAGGTEGEPIYLDLQTSNNGLLDAEVRFIIANNSENESQTVLAERVSRLSASQNDRTKAKLLPEQPVNAGEDDKLILEARDLDGSRTLDVNSTTTQIPTTFYE